MSSKKKLRNLIPKEEVKEMQVPKFKMPDITSKNKIINIYPYTDEKGKILYEVIQQRKGPEYLCRRPVEKGVYEYSIKNVKRVIYNLPRIIQAIKNNEVIFITEGESKVNTLTELNIPATTVFAKTPNKWVSFYNKYLIGVKGIVIIQDDNQYGINFSNNTYQTLSELLPKEKIGIMPISEICPNLNKLGADITDVREYMRDDEKLTLILKSIASQI